MQELEVINITNPTSKDFSWRYNGELFTIKSGETQAFAKPVGFHLAKHLSTQMICDEEMSKATAKELKDPQAGVHVKVSQLNAYDTHERRIALYKILGHEDKVIQVIMNYPFKGFIGDMDEFQRYVDKVKPKEKPEEVVAK